MWLTEFLLALRDTAGESWADDDGSIRNGDFCPITEVYGRCTGEWLSCSEVRKAAGRLGLQWRVANDIIAAADWMNPWRNAEYAWAVYVSRGSSWAAWSCW